MYAAVRCRGIPRPRIIRDPARACNRPVGPRLAIARLVSRKSPWTGPSGPGPIIVEQDRGAPEGPGLRWGCRVADVNWRNLGSRVALGAALPLAMLLARAAGGDDAKPGGRQDIREVLEAKCLACHSAETKKGGLDLLAARVGAGRRRERAGDRAGPAGREPADREARGRRDAAERARSGPRSSAACGPGSRPAPHYPAEPLAARRAGPDWWSLRPIRRVPPPAVRDPALGPQPDRRVRPGRARTRRPDSPRPRPTAPTLIRRVTFDLIGLPPTPEEVDAFVADPQPDAYERLVDRLLASPHYGERWGRHWLDVVRFAESHGYETNQPPARRLALSRLRHPGLQPRHAVRPVRRGAARRRRDRGRRLARPQAATGFLVGGAHDVVGNQAPEGRLQQRADDLDDMITATGDGLPRPDGPVRPLPRPQVRPDHPDATTTASRPSSPACSTASARCPRPTPSGAGDEAEPIRAELARVDRELDDSEPLGPPRPRTRRRGRRSTRSATSSGSRRSPARFVRFTVQATNNGTEPCIDELEVWTAGPTPRNVALADRRRQGRSRRPTYPRFRHPQARAPQRRPRRQRPELDLRRCRARAGCRSSWPEAATIDRIVWGRDREGEYRDRLADRVLHRGRDRAGPLAGRRLVGRPGHLAGRRRRPIRPSATSLLRRRDELRERLGCARRDDQGLRRARSRSRGRRTCSAAAIRSQKRDRGRPVGRRRRSGPPSRWRPTRPRPSAACALARWIADPANPLPARVMVNRALALPLRPGDRRDAERLRLQRRPPVAPRAARLAGRASSSTTAAGSSRSTG